MASDPDRPIDEQLSFFRRKFRYDTQIRILALLISLPGAGIAEVLLWFSGYSPELKWVLTVFIVVAWLVGSAILQDQVVRPLQTLSNMAAGIREEDFSFRVRASSRKDSLTDLIDELNAMADRLQDQKVGSVEATALLKKVLMEIDVAVFAFDQQHRLQIVNRAGEQLLGKIGRAHV